MFLVQLFWLLLPRYDVRIDRIISSLDTCCFSRSYWGNISSGHESHSPASAQLTRGYQLVCITGHLCFQGPPPAAISYFLIFYLNNLLKSALLPADQQGSFKLLGRMVEAAQASDKVQKSSIRLQTCQSWHKSFTYSEVGSFTFLPTASHLMRRCWFWRKLKFTWKQTAALFRSFAAEQSLHRRQNFCKNA